MIVLLFAISFLYSVPVEGQIGMECLDELTRCSTNYTDAVQLHVNEPALVCGDMITYQECLIQLLTMNCGSETDTQIQAAIDQNEAIIASLGSACSNESTSAPSISAECAMGMQECNNDYNITLQMHMDQPELFCGDMNTFLECLTDLTTTVCGPALLSLIRDYGTQAQEQLELGGSTCKITAVDNTTVSNCIDTMSACSNAMGDDLTDYCSAANAYTSCVFSDVACNTPAYRNQTISMMKQQLDTLGVNCELKNGVFVPGSGTATEIPTVDNSTMSNCFNTMSVCSNSMGDDLTDYCSAANRYTSCVFDDAACNTSAYRNQTFGMMKQQLEFLGVNCELKNGVFVPGSGTATEIPTVDNSTVSNCVNTMSVCSNTMGDDLTDYCSAANRYTSCVFNDAACNTSAYRNQTFGMMKQQLETLGVNCELKDGVFVPGSVTQADCNNALLRCGDQMQESLSSHQGVRSLLCNDFDMFISCIRAGGCSEGTVNEQMTILDDVKSGQGLLCGTDYWEATTPDNGDGPNRNTENSQTTVHKNLQSSLIPAILLLCLRAFFW